MKKYPILFLMLSGIISINSWGQATGDYRSHATGSWNSANNWEKYNGTSWDYPAAEFPPVSSLSKKVTIQSGHTITATSNITGSSTTGIIEVASGGTLNMGSYYIRGTGTATSKTSTLTIDGNLSTASYINATNFSIGSSGKFTSSYNGTNGWWNGTATPSPPTLSGEVEFNGAEQKIPGSAYSIEYNDIIVSGGTKTIYSDLTVNGKLTVNQNASLVLNGNYCYMVGTEIANNGTLNGTDSYLYFDGGTQTITGTGTFGEAFEEINVGSSTAADVTLSNTNLFIAYNINIPSGTFSIEPNCRVDILTSLDTGTDGLILKAATSSPYTCASLIIAPDATVTGDVQSNIYLIGGGDGEATPYQWHYISPPVTSVSTDIFTGVTQDLAQYVESRPTLDPLDGWVAYDGYEYVSGIMGATKFTTLTAGKGYDFWDGSNNTFTLSGTPNITDVDMSLGFSNRGTASGFNLLGNPFSSGLNWDDITNSVYFEYPANTSLGLYFTRNDQACYYINGVRSPPDVSPIIPPMQGFFVKTYAANSLTLPAAARTHNSIHERYKGQSSIPLIRLQLTRNPKSKDETVVRFDNKAQADFDLFFDAYKFSLNSNRTYIYSVLGGAKYAINGQPYPASFTEIPLVINVLKDTIHTISVTELEGLSDYKITLKDNSTGITTDLRTTPVVSFSSAAGIIADRFVLRVSFITTGVEDPLSATDLLNIYYGNNNINILTVSDKWDGKTGTVIIMDLTGRIVTTIDNTEFSRNSLVSVPFNSKTGIYVVEIRSGPMRHTGKVVVR